MKDQLSCAKCGSALSGSVTRCPACASWTRTAQSVRRRGGMMIVLGLLLVGMMGTITFMVAPTMLTSGGAAGGRFTGTREQTMLILGLFGIVIVFGIACIASGLWQIVTGRRNVWIVVLILSLAFLLVVAGAAVYRGLGRGNDRGKVGDVGSNLLVPQEKS